MIYCDTSLLVAALARESETERVLAWLRSLNGRELCTCSWTVTEFSSALAMKYRRRELSAPQRAEIQTSWRALLDSSLALISFPEPAFDLAARFCEMSGAVLRAGDALHLAVASLSGSSLATLDHAMAEAAVAVGVAVEAV